MQVLTLWHEQQIGKNVIYLCTEIDTNTLDCNQLVWIILVLDMVLLQHYNYVSYKYMSYCVTMCLLLFVSWNGSAMFTAGFICVTVFIPTNIFSKEIWHRWIFIPAHEYNLLIVLHRNSVDLTTSIAIFKHIFLWTFIFIAYNEIFSFMWELKGF